MTHYAFIYIFVHGKINIGIFIFFSYQKQTSSWLLTVEFLFTIVQIYILHAGAYIYTALGTFAFVNDLGSYGKVNVCY